jgi:hypothetical protein
MEMFRFGAKHASPSPTAILLPENKERPLSSYEEDLFEELRLTHLNPAENAI